MFFREFWQDDSRGVDVLTLPPEISAAVVKYVNAALKYGWNSTLSAMGTNIRNKNNLEFLQ